MSEIHTYPAMNETIKDLLRRTEEPMQQYALARIEELKQQVEAYKATGMTPAEADQLVHAAKHMMFADLASFVTHATVIFDELEEYRRREKRGDIVKWTYATERKPDTERRELIRSSPPGAYLYPCLVTRRSEQVEGRVYVAKHYYDGEEFLNNGEEVCTEFIIAWAPLPEPAEEEKDDG